ncbi:ATP-dependent RNA helicase DDX18 [Sigmodon hispidus]
MANDAGPDTKKAKNKESSETSEEAEDGVKEPDDKEVPNKSLGLTGAFEDTSFAFLSNLVNENTLEAIERMSFKHMTEIQHKRIWPLLENTDILTAAKTGSGNPLAFLIPVIELIVKLKFMPRSGTGVLIPLLPENWPCKKTTDHRQFSH